MAQNVAHGPEELREWRRINGWSQQDVAGAVGLAQAQAISNLECGRAAPSFVVAIRLQLLTGIEPLAWADPEARRLQLAKAG
jgi:transcriptional regulator with XRE-family HTH domain